MNSDSRMDGVRRTSGAWTPLYAAQPPAVAVPAEWLKNSGWARVPLREQARTVAVPSRMSYKNATQEFADGYNACIDDMLAATPQGASCLPAEMTPAMMRAVQMRSELGAYAAANLSGAYDLFADFWRVAVEEVKKGGA